VVRESSDQIVRSSARRKASALCPDFPALILRGSLVGGVSAVLARGLVGMGDDVAKVHVEELVRLPFARPDSMPDAGGVPVELCSGQFPLSACRRRRRFCIIASNTPATNRLAGMARVNLFVGNNAS
jgi:hypothetical protein